MTEQQRRILSVLDSRGGSGSPRELREAIGLPPRTFTRALSRLHAEGLLSERSKGIVRLSPAGRALLQQPARDVRPGTGGSARATRRSQPVAFPPPPAARRTALRPAVPRPIEPASAVESPAAIKTAPSRTALGPRKPTRQLKTATRENQADVRPELEPDGSYLRAFVRGLAGGCHGQAASPERSGFLQGFFGGG